VTTSDTPETDKATIASGGDWSPVLRETCRRLERERDEWSAMCGRYKQERDEAREALSDWENAELHVEADHPDEKHCGCVSVLRKLLTDARSERDEAREAFVIAADQMVVAQCKLRESNKERDEAREKYDNLATEHMLVVNKICGERDEARKQIDDYRERHDLLPISWEL
jgi:hypothetical protein